MTDKQRLQTAILDILDLYTDMIGAVPIQMLHYHCRNHPMYSTDCSIEEVIRELNELRLNGKVDVAKAYVIKR